MAYLISSIFTLTLVMDPMGNLPVFISTLKGVPEERRKKIVIRELFIALFIMMFFLFFGKSVMTLLNINVVSLSVAGGIILFIIALGMIFPGKTSFADNPGGEPFIVPLAIPLVCGPSTLTIILIFTMREPQLWNIWLMVILCAWLINIIILGFSNQLSKLLGKRGLLALEKLMGMVLITLSVQMVLEGIKKFLSN
ncbi:MAG: NAAT family transporter [Elusimicrobiales bacterium]|nr:NAAT family transporter [Elusimicrobiales bacterium]